MRALAVVLLVACACSSNGEKEALKLANDLAVDALANIDTAMKSGKPVSGIFDCVATAGIDTLTKAGGEYAERAKKLQLLCEHDVPLAAIAKSVEEAEAARAKSPSDKMLTQCVINDITIALPSLKNRDDAKALLARYAVACPDEKLP